MSRLALALLLAVPLTASAQYPAPYPYPAPPPVVRVVPYGHPPPPPPPVYVPARAPQPSPFYFNLGLGYGVQGWYAPQAYGSFGGLAYHAEAGARLMPQLLLGFDLSGMTTFASGYGGAYADVTLLDYDAVLTLFPFVHGFFLRGGGGLSTLTSVPYGMPGVGYLGTNVLLGAGWAFPVAPPFHVTLGVDWTHQFFGSYDVNGLSAWMMRVGFGFY
jgi:hypothetical protein